MNHAALDDPEPFADVVLKGTTRGLEILISGKPSVDALGDRLCELLAEAPAFFAGSDARVAVDGRLPDGGLTVLERVASRFDLKLVEIAPRKPKLAEGTGKVAEEIVDISAEASERGRALVARGRERADYNDPPLQASLDIERIVELIPDDPEVELPPGPRLVTGPVRSGVIVDHPGHVIVVGDVNPGAEVRATGSIMVLGRLRGVAHAGIGQQKGFIIALSLQPQQLRVGRMVARSGDADRPPLGAEIAYITGETIVVERFTGRLPSGLAASM